MSSNRLRLEGLSELREALRNLPSGLAGEARHMIEAAANSAAADIKGQYSRGPTGNLIEGVSVRATAMSTFAASATVESKSPHAWMYENGTQVRHTASGANRGSMPAAPPGRAFIPAVIRNRRRMYTQLADLLERAGLTVSGSAE